MYTQCVFVFGPCVKFPACQIQYTACTQVPSSVHYLQIIYFCLYRPVQRPFSLARCQSRKSSRCSAFSPLLQHVYMPTCNPAPQVGDANPGLTTRPSQNPIPHQPSLVKNTTLDSTNGLKLYRQTHYTTILHQQNSVLTLK